MSENGLYDKYEVYKNGEPVKDCFVLEPEKDQAAREALARYAGSTTNESLAADIREWLDIETNEDSGRILVKCESCGMKIHHSRAPICSTCERRKIND